MSKTKTTPAQQAILEVLKVEPQASATQIAVSASVGRSTAGKLLTQLESDGKVRRTEGGRDGKRRLPDLWSLAATRPTANGAKANRAQGGKFSGGDGRLKPGELEPLVLDFLRKNADGSHSPTAVAKGLERSSGAVGNCLDRLTEAKKVQQVGDKPRRYSLAA